MADKFEKTSFGVTVSVNTSGYIIVNNTDRQSDSGILIAPEEVPILVEWLNEAKHFLLSKMGQ